MGIKNTVTVTTKAAKKRLFGIKQYEMRE